MAATVTTDAGAHQTVATTAGIKMAAVRTRLSVIGRGEIFWVISCEIWCGGNVSRESGNFGMREKCDELGKSRQDAGAIVRNKLRGVVFGIAGGQAAVAAFALLKFYESFEQADAGKIRP